MSVALEKLFARIQKITDTLEVNFFHLSEEVGELATEIMVEGGHTYKKAGKDGVEGEIVDVLVCALALWANKRYNLEYMYELLDSKIGKWERALENPDNPVLKHKKDLYLEDYHHGF